MKSKITSIIKNINNTTNTTSSVYNVSDESSGNTSKIYQADEAETMLKQHTKE